MGEAVIGAAVGATVDVLLQNLLKFPVEKINLICNLDKDLKMLKESVITTRDFLSDAEMKQVIDNPVKRWLKKLEDVAFDADNVFDELSYQLLRNKIRNQVRSIFSTSNPILFRRRMVQKIKGIRRELKLINQEACDLGLQMRLARAGTEVSVPTRLETDSFAMDRVFVGRDEDVKRIVEMVTSSQIEEVFSVLPIVGMGGLGKTTLVRTIYNDGKISSHFGERVWVHVSEDFDPVSVFKNMLESLTGEKVEGCREGNLRKLQERMGDRRCLLVLDNVWNEDIEKWDSFMASLEGISHVKGNVIIVTTRKGSVASIVKTLDIHELGVLSEEDCWFIFKAKSFRRESFPADQFESIGKNITKRCRGLPLAAKIVGSLLRDKSKDEWLSIERNWLLDFGGDENYVSKILRLSFDNLSSPSLKKCFAYCSIFPKGSRMEKEQLIDLWMAEGLFQIDQENDMGNQAFNLLVQSSLLQVWETDYYGNVKRCGMHDLVHDLASSILSPKSMDDTYQVRYIFPISFKDRSSPIPKENVKCLRTLFFIGEVSHILFSKFKSLHVLILCSENIKELPILIGKLIHLRYLDISMTRVACLPDSIGELHHFQTLRATSQHGGRSYLRKLPETFKHLVSVRHLYIPNINLPREIGNLVSLQTLPYFRVGDEEGYRITELGRLKNVKGEIVIDNLEKVRDKEEAKAAKLIHKPNIFKLKFLWNESRRGNINDEDVLDGLQPHPNIKSLEINGFKGISFPLWTLRMVVREDLEGGFVRSLENLIEIKLTSCKECEEIPMLGQLPHLKSLYLHGLTNVKSMSSSFYGIEEHEVGNETIAVFPALEKLELKDMTNLTTWEELGAQSSSDTQREVSIFRCLEYLKVINCRQLRSVPSHFPCLKELEIDNMESHLPLANICGSKLTSLTKLKLARVDGVVCLPEGLFHNNRDLSELTIRACSNLLCLVPCFRGGGASLTKLVISNCSNFEDFPQDLHNLNALKELEIDLCPNLKSIPYPSGGRGFTSLCHLAIHHCNELTSLPNEMIESCVQSLEDLTLSRLQSLTNLPQLTSTLQKMTRLIGLLTIEGVPKFIDMATEIGSLPSLKGLGILGSSNLSNFDSIDTSLDRFFPVLKSLQFLALNNMEHCDALPNQLQNLTSLNELCLMNVGIQVLPEWLGNLATLKSLRLVRCQKLRRLPSKTALLRLTKLTFLYIEKCPLLMKNLKGNYFESSKVSHIPYIIVNGILIPVDVDM